MTVLFGLIFLFWYFQSMDLIWGVLRGIPVLRTRRHLGNLFPKVSIIFAARDEAPQVRAALKSMLAQNYPDFEVIAVNDRSTDDTLKIFQEFEKNPRLKIINVEHLPEGWLGKNHALLKGYDKSSGEWLLFTDGDVNFSPDAVKTAVTYAEEESLDHLVIFPKLIVRTFVETIFTSAFFMAFYRRFRPWTVSDPKSKNFMGVGAFNFTSRLLYEKAGTHEKLAMDVIDDMHLGRNLKAVGARQAAVYGPSLVRVQWVKGWQGVLKSLEKNAFAGFDYQWTLVFFATLAGLCLDVLPFIGIFFDGTIFTFSALTVGCIFACYLACMKVHPESLISFPAHPAGTLLTLFVVWRSVFSILRQGGVRWRDTFYPLDRLRQYSKS